MPILTFKPLSAKIHLKHSVEEGFKRSMSFDLRSSDGCTINTPDDRCLSNGDWSMLIYDKTITAQSPDNINDSIKISEPIEDQPIGFLHYLAGYDDSDYGSKPESFFSEVYIDSMMFADLFSALKAGSIPDYISIDVGGMRYGWIPDGSEKIWDIEENRIVPITDISIRCPIPVAIVDSSSKDRDEDWDSTEANFKTLPSTSGDIQHLSEVLLGAHVAAASERATMFWILIGLIVIAIIAVILN